MYAMKKLTLLLLLLSSFFCLAQNEKQETIYLLFDTVNEEKCKVLIEDEGYTYRNKFRKKPLGKVDLYLICDEVFSINKNNPEKLKISKEKLSALKFVDIQYLKKKHQSTNKFKNKIFNKIYLVEKISDKEYVMLDVVWLDDFFLTD